MSFSQEQATHLFELRCRVRRMVAEVLCLLPEGSRHGEAARRLSERYLDSVTSAAALQEVSGAAQELLGRVRYERYERAELREA